MAVLNRKPEASSLPECIVAAIVLLVCFLIVMETLTRVTLTEQSISELSVELTLRQAYREYGDGKHFPGMYTRNEDWGTLQIELKEYSDQLWQLILTALPQKGTRTIKYDYLIKIQK